MLSRLTGTRQVQMGSGFANPMPESARHQRGRVVSPMGASQAMDDPVGEAGSI